MAKADGSGENTSDLDAFFNAAESENPLDIMAAARQMNGRAETDPPPAPTPSDDKGATTPAPAPAAAPSPSPAPPASSLPAPSGDTGDEDGDTAIPPEHLAELTGEQALEGKFIVVDAGSDDPDQPFVLIPAHVYSYVPWWGWTAIAVSLVMLAAGVVLMPLWSLDRLASRLGGDDPATAQQAMRQLIMNGDERTVRKLHDMAFSNQESLTARLRAVDTMSLISGVPEVDRALLRLELAGGTNEQVREAAIAARRHREAARIRGRR